MEEGEKYETIIFHQSVIQNWIFFFIVIDDCINILINFLCIFNYDIVNFLYVIYQTKSTSWQ